MKTNKIVSIASISVIAAAMVAANCVAAYYAPMITTFMCGTGTNFDNEDFQQAANSSDALCKDIARDGIVLMKNENNTLPLSYAEGAQKKINLFGWSSTNQGFLLSGIGSGSSTISDSKKVSLIDAFKADDYEINEDLVKFYNKYDSTNYGYNSSRIKLVEPNLEDYDAYDPYLIDDAIDFSDTAVVVISRINGENVGEIPLKQNKSNNQGTDESRTYLELSTQEEDLLSMCGDCFNNVIVVINSTNQMQLGYLNDPRIDAVLNVGIMGQSGATAIPEILDGSINPSGHLTDTYAYDYTKEPSFANKFKNGNHIAYTEDIYFGYRWYETADTENYFADETLTGYDVNGQEKTLTGYDAMVQYPFGHGLSYTTFDWKVESVKITNGEAETTYSSTDNKLVKNSHVDISLSCTNTGDVSGKDIIQLYYSAPYEVGEIEKSSINLADYAKTVELEPGKTQTNILVSLDSYDMASYDCYDLNENDSSTYELDSGEYILRLMEDSHTAKNIEAGSTYTFKVDNDIVFDTDPTTGETIENRFTGEDAYAGTPIDGSTVYTNPSDAPVYLTRSDFVGTFPQNRMKTPTNSSAVSAANSYTNTSFNQSVMPTTGVNSNLYLRTKEDGSKATMNDLIGKGDKTIINDALVQKIGKDYNCSELDQIVDQMSVSELFTTVEDSGFGTPAIESIGKSKNLDYDGPAGFNANTQGVTSGEWTAFPNETLIGQTWSKFLAKLMGQSMGLEGQATGLSGWYAPGVNLHRSPYNGRNYEYYSEDSVLSGYMAANIILGAKSKNLYVYLKHFTLSEPGDNARNLNTWLTEQNFREIYLKPFEIAVKKGKANAMMSAFNYIGGVWAGANKAMNIDILRNEWGFEGSMITDWSDGAGSMNTGKGVRGGNDIWLNPVSGNNASHLSSSSATDVYCAKMASKNVIFTYCNTYTFYKNYVASEDENTIEITEITTVTPFAWWIPLLAGIDVLVAAGLGCWLYFVVIRKPKKA
ncbi:MAG: glycoside hydrolase family 3 N-terminal domain-containing protein [Bacilli bacterium]